MSWLISKALLEQYENSRHFQAWGGVSSGESSSAGKPFALLNVMHTPQPFWRKDRTMETWSPSQFGLTYAPLTADHGAALLTWYLGVFHAKESPPPDSAEGSTTNDPAFGQNLPESFAKLDREKSIWKTPLFLPLGDLEEFCETWPRWGIMLYGECFPLPTLAHDMSVRGFGFSLPTIVKSEWRGAARNRFIGSPNFRGAVMSEGLRNCESDPIYIHPGFAEVAMNFPFTWTELKPLETHKFQSWRREHTESLNLLFES